jgi:hypothetical protein
VQIIAPSVVIAMQDSGLAMVNLSIIASAQNRFFDPYSSKSGAISGCYLQSIERKR